VVPGALRGLKDSLRVGDGRRQWYFDRHVAAVLESNDSLVDAGAIRAGDPGDVRPRCVQMSRIVVARDRIGKLGPSFRELRVDRIENTGDYSSAINHRDLGAAQRGTAGAPDEKPMCAHNTPLST
jgi:hypothetical protein